MNSLMQDMWSEDERRLLRELVRDEEAFGHLEALLARKLGGLQHHLSTSESYYKAIIDAQDDLVCRYEPYTCRMTFANQAYAQSHGRSIEEVVGANLFELIPPENRERARAVVADMVANPRPIVTVFPASATAPEDQTRWYQWSDNPIFDEAGQLIEVQTVARDVTSLKRLEREQVERQVEQEQRRIITDFIRDASHEFRTPLTIMRSSVYIARKSENLEKIYTRLDKIEAQAVALTRLVDELVLMARLDGDIPPDRLWRADVQFALRGVLEALDEALQGRRVAVHWALLPDIVANHHDLALAFREVMQNAIAHTQANEGIEIRLMACDDGVDIVIEDTGDGIASQDLPHVWERFYRSDHARTTRGFGLGLPIVKRIVEAHGGQVEIESTLGVGTRVRLCLPIQPPTKADSSGA